MKTTIETTMGERRCSRNFSWIATLLIAAALLGGCGGGSGGSRGGSKSPGVYSDPTVTETLETLGIDTTEGPLLDEGGNTIPENYSPLGPQFEMNKISELVVLGVETTKSHDPITLWDLENSNPQSPELLTSFGGSDYSWALEKGSNQWLQTQRAGIGADLDGDGREEQVYVHNDYNVLWYTVIEDEDHGYARTSGLCAVLPWKVEHLSIASADVNGDGDQEIVLGYSATGVGFLEVLDYFEPAALIRSAAWSFHPQHQGDLLMLEIASGNIDYDPEDELGVVVNETFTWGALAGCSSYVLDVDGTTFSEKYAGAITAGGYLAECGDVAMGDLDADGMDEIVFAGCPLPSSIDQIFYSLVSLDYTAYGLEQDSAFMEYNVEGNLTQVLVMTPHVNLVDFEGDYACEVHVNNLVFPDWKNHDPWSSPFELDDCYLPGRVQEWSLANHAFAVGDFTGPDYTSTYSGSEEPRRQDLAVVARGFSKVSIWGIAGADPTIRILREIPLKNFSENSDVIHPRLIPVNTDVDGTTAEFVEHEYVLTEPVILAVMAAAPSITGPGQNKDANLTEFGVSSGHGSGGERHFTFTAGLIVGSEFEVGGQGYDIELDFGFELERTTFTNSMVTCSEGYGAGWRNNTVVCTSVPYDIYRYRVIQDPAPENIDKIVEVSVPRTPFTGIHGVGFYNEAVGKDAVKVDTSLLKHTIGRPYTYPTKQKMLQLTTGGNGLFNPSLAGAAGPSDGFAYRGINVWTEVGHTLYTGGSFDFCAKSTGVFKIGGRFGFGGGHTWSWTTENEKSYMGVVGSVDEVNYLHKAFKWGLFCHWHQPDNGLKYQVINYWVE